MSFKIYNVTETEICHKGYEVKINGNSADLNTARVSAMPFNRRWPGHQRSKEQTELINFLSLETDEELTFEIKPEDDFDRVDIKPKSLGITPLITCDKRIIFTLKKPAYFTVEPFGRKNALHIFADPILEYNIDKNDESILYFGKGEHNVGMINLKSNQTVFIDEGAVLYACIHAKDADNIKILGRGILDNSKNKEQVLFEANEENNASAVNNVIREHTIQLEYCNNVKIEGITIRDSLVYNIRPIGCSDLDIKNVKIIGCWRYNSDGIDMHNCIDVKIDNCFLRTFDDAICVKGFDCYYDGDVEKAVFEAMYRNGKSYDIFKNVLITNCVIWNDWGKCLEIGAETRAEEIYDVNFENNDIIHCVAYPLDCMNVDYADVHDVSYKNIRIEYDHYMPPTIIQKNDNDKYEENLPSRVHNPAVINVSVEFHHEYSADGERRGKNTNFTFENIKLYGVHQPRFRFFGYNEESKVSNVTIKDFYRNDKPLKTDDYEIEKNEFAENINIILNED